MESRLLGFPSFHCSVVFMACFPDRTHSPEIAAIQPSALHSMLNERLGDLH